jgi:hypothetical protein
MRIPYPWRCDISQELRSLENTRLNKYLPNVDEILVYPPYALEHDQEVVWPYYNGTVLLRLFSNLKTLVLSRGNQRLLNLVSRGDLCSQLQEIYLTGPRSRYDVIRQLLLLRDLRALMVDEFDQVHTHSGSSGSSTLIPAAGLGGDQVAFSSMGIRDGMTTTLPDLPTSNIDDRPLQLEALILFHAAWRPENMKRLFDITQHLRTFIWEDFTLIEENSTDDEIEDSSQDENESNCGLADNVSDPAYDTARFEEERNLHRQLFGEPLDKLFKPLVLLQQLSETHGHSLERLAILISSHSQRGLGVNVENRFKIADFLNFTTLTHLHIDARILRCSRQDNFPSLGKILPSCVQPCPSRIHWPKGPCICYPFAYLVRREQRRGQLSRYKRQQREEQGWL